MSTHTLHTHGTPETELDRGGRSAWGAIFAGTAIALAAFLTLLLLGLSLGFVNVDPHQADKVDTHFVGAGFYLFLSQLIALGAGGYVAGRLAGVLHKIGSALHGATVWALATLLAAWLASASVSTMFSLVAGGVSSAASAVSSTASAVIPDDFSLPDVSAVSFDDLPDSVQRNLREEGITPDNFKAEAREAFRQVISQDEQERIVQQGEDTLRSIVRNPADARAEVNDYVDTLFGRGGVLSDEDRQQAIAVMERRFGITQEEANAYIDQVQAEAQELQAEAERALENAKQEAIEAAAAANEALRKAAILGFLASLLGLAAAVAGAVAGGMRPFGTTRY